MAVGIREVSEWLKPLKPDEVIKGWSLGKPPSKAPDIKDGYKVFHAWWD